MAKKLYEEQNIQAIANAIRSKNGLTDTYKTSEMAAAIQSIPVGGGGDLPEEALNITGSCTYRFSDNGLNWLVNVYGDRITTKNISSAESMFRSADKLTVIPFDINLSTNTTYVNATYMFEKCAELVEIPKITGKIGPTNSIFSDCKKLRSIPYEKIKDIDWTYHDTLTNTSSGARNSMFNGCFSLRSIPMEFLKHVNTVSVYSRSYFYGGFKSCYVLDELVDLPVPFTGDWTGNAFYDTFLNCYRLKNVTFATLDGQPYTMNWKNQVIDLSKVGYVPSSYLLSNIINYNSGITEDKYVNTAETYQALKDDPDMYTDFLKFSRYDHDSAVATINSLPDTSAYLASAGGTNTIKFTGNAGYETESGAINTLTEEEIAVATAKGWTVTFA